MEQFPHLRFSEKIIGSARFYGGGGDSDRTEKNKKNRADHSESLNHQISTISENWNSHLDHREREGLAPLNPENIPMFLQIDPNLVEGVDFELRKKFGIEIISEEEDGFIIGSSTDNLRSLKEKIEGFIEKVHGTGKIAQFWEIIDGERELWKLQHVLSPELYEKWPSIEDDEIYVIEVSIAFDFPLGPEPDPTKCGGEKRLEKFRRTQLERDEKQMEREGHFMRFIHHYDATINSGLVHLEDSFGCEISISGKGLKDLVANYPFVFEVSEKEEITGIISDADETQSNTLEILSPEMNAPEIGVVDSGIMEGHQYLSPAIKNRKSLSYIKNDPSVADGVPHGGHGTKVAGAILYPKGISHLAGTYQLPCFVRNIRVLNNQNKLLQYPPRLMEKIVEDNPDIRIFNMSINSEAPHKVKHMSMWAATLDKLIHRKNILFLNSVGNLGRDFIRYCHRNGIKYPDYLEERFCRIANPSQSSFGVSVGSVNHLSLDNTEWESIGKQDEVAPYSRIGNGIWGHIKPDVVEYGGGMKISKNGLFHITEKDVAIELVRSTLNGGYAYNKESSGTSFATPKVSAIAAELLKVYPEENINLIRALIVQGARLPGDLFYNPTTLAIKQFGYGIPSLDRVTRNSEHRITFYNTNEIRAEEGQIYSLDLPESLLDPGEDYDILIEVSLAFTAKIRRTRQRTKSYLATRLSWKSSKLEDNYENFKNRVLKEIDGVELEKPENTPDGTIHWKIREQTNWGVPDISRNNSSLQKDWAILKSYKLPETLYFSINAHKGWDASKEPIPYALVVSIEILGQNIPIYEDIQIANQIEIET